MKKTLSVLYILFMCSPLLIVIGAAFEPQEILRFPPHGISLTWFERVLQTPAFLDAAANSLVVGLLAMVLSVLLGLLAAYALARGSSRYRETILGLLLSPLVIPELVIGLALLQMLILMDIATDLTTLVLAHTVICLPYTVRLLFNGVNAISESLENASLLLGASRGGTIVRVTLPLMKNSIVAAALFAFLTSFDNTVISLFLVDASTMTLPITIYNYVEFNLDPAIAALSTILILLSCVVVSVVSRVSGLDNGGLKK
ncbi:ABC transporter permease [Verticiella sediminum]|uniref:ABC transporter permease n=1 Tax=Verticiella sediminum TaxID=1247510 RepID=A0A556AE98_9BURK|nr:ABC transporter permease [Verticiella sediminum]TSH91207.1 ABC transporter permease [Verticiella sediminum]